MSICKSLTLLIILVVLSACHSNTDIIKPINTLIPAPVSVSGFEAFATVSSTSNNINVSIDKALEEEEYHLEITKEQISIKCVSSKGEKFARTTLQQLENSNNGRLPICTIQDKPRFTYRGMHLDVARHFYSVQEVKKYLDYMAYYKFNTFHWHLTEDQGWRIEIKKYPKLQSIAAYRKETLIGHYNDQPQQYDGEKYGGFYTQEEIKEIVAHAKKLGIEVIPEIEMPGHSLAALAAYPELGCGDGPYETATKWGVFDDVYCPTETTFNFLQDVIDEIITLFPSKYIHIGGDECPKTAWKNSKFCQDLIRKEGLKDEHGLQSYFITRMEKYINSKGKQIIGWDEILEGGLAPNATVMSWRGEQGGIDAANQNHNVIMTPTDFCYLDYYQSESPDEPLAIGGYLPVEKVYGWSLIPEALPNEKHQYVLGGQGNVWTEYMPSYKNVEYMAYNRMIALSEVLWSEQDRSRTFESFKPRFAHHLHKWKDQGVNIANHLLDIKANVKNTVEAGSFMSFPKKDQVFVSFNGGNFDSISESSFSFEKEGTYQFYREKESQQGKVLSINYIPHLGVKAHSKLLHKPSNKYSGNGPRSMINGVKGSDSKYGDAEWLGFSGDDCILELTFEESVSVSGIDFRTFNGPGQWIYLPSKIEVTTEDGTIHSIDQFDDDKKVITSSLDLGKESTKTLKIHIFNYGKIPEGKQGGGHPAWLFVDEITIR